MDLEQVGGLFDADKLKAKLQKKFPNYNFDVPHHQILNAKHHFIANRMRLNIQIWKATFTVGIGTS